jgi:hypothetical protein
MGLREFVATFGRQEATVAVVDREAERPVYRLLVDLFDTDAVAVRDVEADSGPHPTNTTVLRKADTHDDIAVSSLDAVRDELLLVNSDIYVTGARDLCDVDLPEVVAGLDGVPFRVSDRARQPKGKLVLIEMSRAIEAMAWRDGTGRLDAGFQHLSPITDERGTERVYTRLGADTDVETCVYGVPGDHQSLPSVGVRAADTRELRRSWFVVYRSGSHPGDGAALVAYRTEDAVWEGCWTYDRDSVAAVLDYLDTTYA